ncbi:MAG: enhanced serine sensitivity protein SseB C-terminal domain-containing protein [Ruminiclostridium sp.]|nr:enhanced serine sensitivity protein SseB C-terminal domain-containing protein [Ruminiclostridium sp.]
MADNHIKFPTSDDNNDETTAPIAPEINPPKPEEVFPDLGNEKLVAAMEALKDNENKETQTALIENVIGAKFFAPVEVIDADGNVLKGSGKVAIPKDAKFNFKLIQNAKGEQYFAVFTDIRQFMLWSKSPKVNTIIVVFPQIAQLAQQRADVISGFVINPMGQNIIFSQDAISNLLEAMKQVAEREKQRRESGAADTVKLLFGKPQNIPDAVYGAFRKKLAKIPEVREAYFCMLKQGDQEYYLFTLDIDADSERSRTIGDSVCESAKLFLTKYPIMAAPTNSPFGEGARKVGSAFYTKEG